MRPAPPERVIIIGAGVAGLAAANELVRHNIRVTLYEQMQTVGGRVATYQVQDCIIDHGAQVVKAPTPRLLQLVTQGKNGKPTSAQDIGLPVWTFTAAGAINAGDPGLNAEPQWMWSSGINTLGKIMSAGLDIRLGVHVQRITPIRHGYALHDTQGNTLDVADAVLFTPPAPQTAAIIAESTLPHDMKDTLLRELLQVTYRRTLSVALAYPHRLSLPWYALVNIDRQHNIAWLACEHTKPGHAPLGTGLLIAQMSHDFTLAHWDVVEPGTYGADNAPLPPRIAHIHAQVQMLLPSELEQPRWADVQHWQYALPDSSADFDRLNTIASGLFFAGDYVTALGRIHLAIESGWNAAERIQATHAV